MYTSDADVKELEARFGAPAEREMEYEIAPWEHSVVVGSMHKGRAHDITFFIRKSDDADRLVVVSKPFFPHGAFRAPSGAAKPGESLEEGALREAREETGTLRFAVRNALRAFTLACVARVDTATSRFTPTMRPAEPAA